MALPRLSWRRFLLGQVMTMSEPITQELRKAMIKYGWCDGDNIVFSNYPPNIDEEQALLIRSSRFDNLCDAIDAVHANLERENESLRRELDRVTGEMEEHHAWAPESHYVMLPKDADGEPIHIGDVMDEMLPFGGYAAPAPIDTMELSRGASGYGWMVKLDAENRALISPKLLRHHHADSWERIIKDALTMPFHGKADVAQFVARCKALAGDAE